MRSTRELPILITSAIGVAADRTTVVDEEQRIKWTLHALLQWRQMNPRSRIVLCDGSGCDLREHLDMQPALARDLEFISFRNDTALVKAFGKGRGEGEIIKHALQNSAVLADADAFCKCTGKLWVENHRQFVDARRGPFSFDYYGRMLPTRLDTRYYIARKPDFCELLRDVYVNVDEPKGIDLESAYTEALRDMPLRDYVSPVVPLIAGLSGSMGVQYAPTRRHALLKGARNRLARLFPSRANR
jgi:hypothetical protein